MIKYRDITYEQCKIAILLATYNGEKYLRQQLDSLIQQSYSNFICFIHDDGSSDGTKAIIDFYCSSYPERFINIMGPRCGGAKENFIYMLREVQADYIMFCDQDDYWLKEKVKKSFIAMEQTEKLFGHDNPVCVYSDVSIVNKDLDEISKSYFMYMKKDPYANSLKDLLKTNVVIGSTMMINSALCNIVIKVKNVSNIYMHDWWCAIICSIKGQFAYLNEPLILYRQHENNIVGAWGKNGIIEKLRNLFFLKDWVRVRKAQIQRPRNFAKELLMVIPRPFNQMDFLYQFSTIDKKKKLYRLLFYYNNKLFIKNQNLLIQCMLV